MHACLLGPFGNNMDDHQLRESVDQSRSTSNAVDGCVGVEVAIAACFAHPDPCIVIPGGCSQAPRGPGAP